MLSLPRPQISPNTIEFETVPLINPNGFREYDARWLFPQQINLLGVQVLGLALGTLIRDLGAKPKIIVGHDYRSYSLSIKQALTVGLLTSGAEVIDIGLALSPTAYFAQFELDAPCVAMVTASHNENGWTGVKMGAARPLTFGPDEMQRLKALALEGKGRAHPGGAYSFVPGMRERYLTHLGKGVRLQRRLKAVVACGNGTAGLFAPELFRALGVEVIEETCTPDFTFPAYNPNPEDLEMLHAVAARVRDTGADLGLAFDGDGDRCGVVDEKGHEIFADKIGVLLAREFSGQVANARFVVDVKSTGLFMTDPILKKHGAVTEYWKTGHSYIKRRSHEIKAVAGFEKSGHFFFSAPFGLGFDDGLASAIEVLKMLDRHGDKSMSSLYASLPETFSTPTMSPHCADEKKYDVVARVTAHFNQLQHDRTTILGQSIHELVTVNGVRIVLADGTWGLVRASSNKPSLVVVCESPHSDERMRAMFGEIDAVLSRMPEVGAYDQKISL